MLVDKRLEELLRGEISTNGWQKNFLSGAMINLDSKLVSEWEDMPFNTKDTVLVRSFEMHLKYMPRENHKYRQGDFSLCSYMLSHGAVYVFSWEDFLEKCKEDSSDGRVLNWIKENTNICQTIFDIAKANQESRVPIAFDVIKYGQKLVGDKYKEYPFLSTPAVSEVEKEYTRIYREEFLKSERKRKEAKKCQQ